MSYHFLKTKSGNLENQDWQILLGFEIYNS